MSFSGPNTAIATPQLDSSCGSVCMPWVSTRTESSTVRFRGTTSLSANYRFRQMWKHCLQLYTPLVTPEVSMDKSNPMLASGPRWSKRVTKPNQTPWILEREWEWWEGDWAIGEEETCGRECSGNTLCTCMDVSKIIKKKRHDERFFYNYYDQYTLRRVSMHVCVYKCTITIC